ncbi:hypothetical protein [Diaphorobacter sp.]|uniref:hypothetical protein n=1 Tax=Diaphorobacter sp. TaxID=1934310 RepID=UPI00338E86EB
MAKRNLQRLRADYELAEGASDAYLASGHFLALTDHPRPSWNDLWLPHRSGHRPDDRARQRTQPDAAARPAVFGQCAAEQGGGGRVGAPGRCWQRTRPVCRRPSLSARWRLARERSTVVFRSSQNRCMLTAHVSGVTGTDSRAPTRQK